MAVSSTKSERLVLQVESMQMMSTAGSRKAEYVSKLLSNVFTDHESRRGPIPPGIAPRAGGCASTDRVERGRLEEK